MDGRVLFLGNAERHEWTEIVAHLQETTGVVIARHGPAALAALRDHPSLYRVLVAPSYRDEFPRELQQQILSEQPLADIVVLVGPWLEGETRSGRPWPGARRVYAHQAIPWTWQPSTCSTDEGWLRIDAAHQQPRSGIVVVCAQLAETRHALSAVCEAAGLTTILHAPDLAVHCRPVEAVIYDAVVDRSRWVEQTSFLQRRYQPAALVVLVSFPRPEECQQLKRAGATTVLGKPYRIEELVASLTRQPVQSCPSSGAGASARMNRIE
jgi:hypothetical protein